MKRSKPNYMALWGPGIRIMDDDDDEDEEVYMYLVDMHPDE